MIQIQSEKKLNLKPWPSPMTARELLRERERRARRGRLFRLLDESRRSADPHDN